jgi:hypothetical protein
LRTVGDKESARVHKAAMAGLWVGGTAANEYRVPFIGHAS